MKHQSTAKVWGNLGIVPKLWKIKHVFGFSSNVFPISSAQGSLAGGQVFMSDLYLPFLEARAEVLSISRDSRRPPRNENVQTLLPPPNRGRATHRIRMCPRTRDSCGHHRKSDLRPESEGWDFPSGLFFHLDEFLTF